MKPNSMTWVQYDLYRKFDDDLYELIKRFGAIFPEEEFDTLQFSRWTIASLLFAVMKLGKMTHLPNDEMRKFVHEAYEFHLKNFEPTKTFPEVYQPPKRKRNI